MSCSKWADTACNPPGDACRRWVIGVPYMVNDEVVADLGKASDAVRITVKSLPISTLPSAVATRSLTTSRLARLMFLSDAGLWER
jgi:hypothetical protein